MLGLALGLVAAGSPVRASGTEIPLYSTLRALQPGTRTCAVKGFTLRREAFTFHLDGTVVFLAPVQDRRLGAVFVGSGSFDVAPAGAEERALALHVPVPVHDTFEVLPLVFTDGTAEEIDRACLAASDAPHARADEAFADFVRVLRRDFRVNLPLRLFAELTDQRSPAGLFVAYLNGRAIRRAIAVVDGSGIEALGAEDLGGAEVALWSADASDPGLWFLAHRAAEQAAGGTHAAPHALDALHYEVTTEVARALDVKGVTTIRARGAEAGVRVIPLRLLDTLRLTRAEVAPATGSAPLWSAVPFVQERAEEDAQLAMVLPAGIVPDREYLMRLTYEGKGVVQDAGDGNFIVKARESWYPNLGWHDPATFDLAYRVPAAYQIVSVGARHEDALEGETRVSRWSSELPLRVAGFNYGKFKERSRNDEESGVDIHVFTNPGTPDAVKEINEVLHAASSTRMDLAGIPLAAVDDSPFVAPPAYVGPSSINVDTQTLADAALADGVNAARIFTAYFGPLRARRVSISQQSQWTFGQSWPSLIYLPYLAALDSTQRASLGLQGAGSFVDSVGFHEFAHQWWGHQVGVASYEDEWLSEGFAEFASALALQYTKGFGAYDRFWERARRWILDTPRSSSVANYAVGPMTLGHRLNSRRNPGAGTALIYGKGAYVLHMLRMTMREAGARNPDAAFLALMQDFAKTYAGREASTRDFQTVLERHMVPALNATGDGRADWFFSQWVRGTSIPRYVSQLEIRKEGADEYRVTGTLRQEGVPADFRVLLPLYLENDRGALVRAGVIPLRGSTTVPIDVRVRATKKPKRAVFNGLHDVLAMD